MTRLPLAIVLALALGAGPAVSAPGQAPVIAPAIPDHPDELRFEPIAFTPPRAEDHRVVLSNGMIVYIAEDRTLPLVNVGVTVRTGQYLDPEGKEGLAQLTGHLIRRGGTNSLTAEQLDERLEFLAANVSTDISDTAGSASLNSLTDNLDETLPLFVEMLREPRFQQDRLELAKEQGLQAMKKRNDDPGRIEAAEFNALLYGEDHFSNRATTAASLAGITRDDLVRFHRAYFHPANMILAVSGSFSRPEMIRRLEEAFAGWPGETPQVPAVPSEIQPAEPGLYRIEKDVPQGRVSVGLPTVTRDNPDIYALEVMNEILGGSGFTSRITRTVRSNEGLAYHASSALTVGAYHPGRFQAVLQSKNPTVAYATHLVLEEIRKIRDLPVTEEELDVIKRNIVEGFPAHFASTGQTMAIFAADAYTGRDPSYWQSYRDRIQAVTVADVQRVARKYLDPERLIVLVVGNQKEIDVGDETRPHKLAELAAGGRVTVLPLRDPLTWKRP